MREGGQTSLNYRLQALSIYKSINKPTNLNNDDKPSPEGTSIKDEMTKDLVEAAERESSFQEPRSS